MPFAEIQKQRKPIPNKKSIYASSPVIWGESWFPAKPLSLIDSIDARSVTQELLRFVAEKHDGHLSLVSQCLESLPVKKPKNTQMDGKTYLEFTNSLLSAIDRSLQAARKTNDLDLLQRRELLPRRTASDHLARRHVRFLIDLRICLRRFGYRSTISLDARRSWQRYMIRTRVLDELLKNLFVNGFQTPSGDKFGGKGFRSTWQEAIVAAASALRVPGDTVSPMIRDVGLALAMGCSPASVIAAQMGKANSGMNGGIEKAGGRDLHVGDFKLGVLPPSAPLPISAATTVGLALASHRLGLDNFHVATIGEGGSSNGEWWEAVNFAGVRGLPVTFILQNNQIALDTPPAHQNAAELWADKGSAFGIPSWTIDGSDPDAFYSSIAVAREFATQGGGATLIHVETMRGCGHAHHHDDLYLGAPSGNPPGYVDRGLLKYWANKDPIELHAKKLLALGMKEKDLSRLELEERNAIEKARQEIEKSSWANPESVRSGVTSIQIADRQEDHLNRIQNGVSPSQNSAQRVVGEPLLSISESSQSWSFARAIQQGMIAIAKRYGQKTIFMGEDMEIAGAFGLNLGLKNAGYQHLLYDMPLSESTIIHSATGAALGGMRPVAEIQFGGFASLAFNALINNAAQLRWRWGGQAPLLIRTPLGGKTRSGPYHANMIESWFANDPGLVVVMPSTPQDAYDLMVEGADLDDPVLYLEHIGLYGLRGGKTAWGENINQEVNTDGGKKIIGKANIVRWGRDITIVTWGAMVHVALNAAREATKQGIEAEVIDLRTLLPFDAATCVASVAHTKRFMVLHEAQWTGGLGHTISSRIIEEAFWSLEAPPVVVGALDTPVPFSPVLEDHTIPNVETVGKYIRLLCGK